MNKNLQKKADEIFGMYPEFKKLFLTSDKQGFSNKTDAEAWAQTLTDKKVYEFEKDVVVDDVKEPTEVKRDELVAEYTRLFGKAPAHNAKAETLQKKIAEKQQEINETPANAEVIPATNADNEDAITGKASNSEE